MPQWGIPLRRGVYAGVLGPSYETPAEVRLLEKAGAHAQENECTLAFTDDMSGRLSVGEKAADLQSLKAQNLVRKTGTGLFRTNGARATWTDAWAYYGAASFQINSSNRLATRPLTLRKAKSSAYSVV